MLGSYLGREFVVEPHIDEREHEARHGYGGAGTDGESERSFRVSQAITGHFLQLGQGVAYSGDSVLVERSMIHGRGDVVEFCGQHKSFRHVVAVREHLFEPQRLVSQGHLAIDSGLWFVEPRDQSVGVVVHHAGQVRLRQSLSKVDEVAESVAHVAIQALQTERRYHELTQYGLSERVGLESPVHAVVVVSSQNDT
ncbi:MAG: hypothetical protein BWY79_01195 [Actinobacteria bacterium ADurb.Bin444]|nr:MAG: hypothetical protein BWY79_01195 [Actinobacteria bacterium ADurb.Bin444]